MIQHVKQMFIACVLSSSLLLPYSATWADAAAAATQRHGLAMYGDLKYPADFKNFEYVNPQAPKGGNVKLAAIGTFDSLNPFIIKGISAEGVDYLFESLLVGSKDEAFSEYGLIAESVEMPNDRSWVIFTLRSQARFHDNSPISVEDVIFSYNTLKEKGSPFYRTYYRDVKSVEKVGERQVKFSFSTTENRELPLIVGQMPILSKAYWSKHDFEKTTLEAPLGSGPYKIDSIEAGRAITYKRVADYWAKDLPVNVGQYNFDSIRIDYYRDSTIALEAFKAGEFDFRVENSAKNWATSYDSPALRDGLFIKEEIKHEIPTGMQAFLFNTRRPVFSDRRVREAIGYLYDFEWANKNLFNGAYTRTNSFFSNSELAAAELPSAEELKLLEPLRGKIPEEVFTRVYQPPKTDGSGNIRDNMRIALQLFEQAGWTVKQGKLVNADNKPMSFEILLSDPNFERVVLPFKQNLERLGIQVNVRNVDDTQYKNRLDEFDFDMIVHVYGQSLSPGNEQLNFWSSEKAEVKGSLNYAGIRDAAIDSLVNAVIAAPDRPQLIQRVRALDRVLLFNHYAIPQWHLRSFRVAYWNKFSRAPITPKYSLGFESWWIDSQKEANLNQKRMKK